MNMDGKEEISTVHALVCKMCNDKKHFTSFDEFVKHTQEHHGGTISLKDMAIITNETNDSRQYKCDDKFLIVTAPHVQHGTNDELDKHIENAIACSHLMPQTLRVQRSLLNMKGVYDLSKLSNNGLIDMMQLFGKCVCIWHKPTRTFMTKKDRTLAYHLLLQKLHEHDPEAEMKDVHEIVRMFILAFVETKRGIPISTNTEQMQRIKSPTIIEQLQFLNDSKIDNVDKVNIDRCCAFCDASFYSAPVVFAHMVQHHVPAHIAKMVLSSVNSMSDTQIVSRTSETSVEPTSMTSARSSYCSLASTPRSSSTNSNSDGGMNDDSDLTQDYGEYRPNPRTRVRAPRKRANQWNVVKRRRSERLRIKRLTQRRAGVSKASVSKTVPIAKTGASDTCVKCSRSFKRVQSLSNHMLREHPPTCCEQCRMTFATAADLKKHLLQQHGKDSSCPMCGHTSGKWQADSHMTEHFYNHVCNKCNATFHDLKQYRQHQRYCRLGREHLRCQHCARYFENVISFRRHSRISHQETLPFKCTKCNRKYMYLTQLLRHEKTHKRGKRN